jgi:hydrogenase maturation protease
LEKQKISKPKVWRGWETIPVFLKGHDMATTLVLGLGNTIMSDDGIGPKVIARLKETEIYAADRDFLDGGTLGLDLLPYLEGVQRLILVDAVETGQPAGTLVRLTGDEVPMALETKLSPHQMGMKDLLAVAQLMGQLPEEIILLGVQPQLIEMGTELSPPVAAAFPSLVLLVQNEISSC